MARPEPLPARYTFDQVCTLTLLSKATIRKRIDMGIFPKPCDKARQFLFNAKEIDNFLNGDVNAGNQTREFDPNAFKKLRASACNYTARQKRNKAILRPTKEFAPFLVQGGRN